MRDDEYIDMLLNSTIVRPTTEGIKARLGRTGMRVLSAVAPELAASRAERVFLTARAAAGHGWTRRALESARRRTLEVSGAQVPVWSWGQGPAVILAHGWGGRGAQLAAFVDPLVARGFSAVAFDAPGHGAASGRLSSLPLMADTLRAVSDAYGARAVIAHSVGAVSTTFALSRGLALDAVAFIGPPADLVAYSRRFAAEMGLSAQGRDLLQARVEARVGVPWAALDVIRLAPDMRVPLLVLHDGGDREVHWEEGVAIADRWPGATLLLTQGLGHRRILRNPQVIDQAVSFVTGHVSTDRSAAPGSPSAPSRGSADVGLPVGQEVGAEAPPPGSAASTDWALSRR